MELLGIVYLLIGISVMYLWGELCRDAAVDKGYSGGVWFWWGFLFGAPALLIICFRKPRDPLYYRKKMIKTLRKYKRQLEAGTITPEEYERKRAEIIDI